MEIVKFKYEHIEEMRFDEMTTLALDQVDLEIFKMYEPHDSHTLINEEGTPIYCGGFVPVSPGVGEAWTMVSEDMKRYPILLHKLAKIFIDRRMIKNNWHRLQATVLAEYSTSVKWLERLGFVNEGLMRCAGPNKEDYFRLAKVI